MAQGIEYFRNTGVGDVLEKLGIWQYPSNFGVQQTERSTEDALNKEVGEIEAEIAVNMGEALTAPTREDQREIEGDSSSSESLSSDQKNLDPFLVDWNGPDDPENPQNWTSGKKGWQISQIMLLTSVTYAGASIYTAGQDAFQEEMKIGHAAATLPLSIYVLGYGLGPIIFSPLSEVAVIGRNNIYLITLFLFTVFQIGAALTPNLGGMIVIRLITGILCSPSLATGGASLGDIVSPEKFGLVLGAWAVGAVAAPVLAPLLGAAMLVAVNWRFIFWFLMIVAGFTFVLMFLSFRESLSSNILHRRAVRVRKETGDNRYYTLQERIDSQISTKDYLKELLLRPLIIQFSEPGVLAFNIYVALIYGAYYLFFEAFPIVFVDIYHFTAIEAGLAFMGFQVGCFFAYFILWCFMSYEIIPSFNNGRFVPENFLKLPMMISWLLPASLFFFGWTAQVHWILPIISEIFFVIALYNLFQCVFAYLGASYPRYLASVFASNGLMRSAFGCSFPLFGKAMFNNLGSEKYPVGWGSSLIGFFTAALAILPFLLYKYGAQLRGRSKYAN